MPWKPYNQNQRRIDIEGEAHEIWALAHLLPGEGILDGVDRIAKKIRDILDHA